MSDAAEKGRDIDRRAAYHSVTYVRTAEDAARAAGRLHSEPPETAPREREPGDDDE